MERTRRTSGRPASATSSGMAIAVSSSSAPIAGFCAISLNTGADKSGKTSRGNSRSRRPPDRGPGHQKNGDDRRVERSPNHPANHRGPLVVMAALALFAWALSRNAPSTTIVSPAWSPDSASTSPPGRGRDQSGEFRTCSRPWEGTRTIRCALAEPPQRAPGADGRAGTADRKGCGRGHAGPQNGSCITHRRSRAPSATPARLAGPPSRRFPGNPCQAVPETPGWPRHPSRPQRRPARTRGLSARALEKSPTRNAATAGSSIWPITAARSMTAPPIGDRNGKVDAPSRSASPVGASTPKAPMAARAERSEARASAAYRFRFLDLTERDNPLGCQAALAPAPRRQA